MNPTTFNLVAVSVFAFMLLSLVGPLLNISPAAVAIALTGCGGLLALDRFSWQGKGGNLLIDLLSGQSSEYRQRILHHEAGHFLAAHLLGIPIQSYTLSAWQGIKAGLPGLGGVIIEPSVPDDDTADAQPLTTQQINRYAIVGMAGIAAETQTYGSAQGGDDDKAQLRSLLQQSRLPSTEIDTQLRWALLQANTLLEKQQAAYQALVAAMAEQESVAVCCEQIETHKVSDSTRFE
ncbi:MAG: ATP-dependent Zn protease [Phormidesmis sp.]